MRRVIIYMNCAPNLIIYANVDSMEGGLHQIFIILELLELLTSVELQLQDYQGYTNHTIFIKDIMNACLTQKAPSEAYTIFGNMTYKSFLKYQLQQSSCLMIGQREFIAMEIMQNYYQ